MLESSDRCQLLLNREVIISELLQLNLDIDLGKIDFLEAWKILDNSLAKFVGKIALNIEEFLGLKEKIFVEYPSFLEDVNLAIAFLRQLPKYLLNNQSNFTSITTTDLFYLEQLDDMNLMDLDENREMFNLEIPSRKLDEINHIELNRKIQNFIIGELFI